MYGRRIFANVLNKSNWKPVITQKPCNCSLKICSPFLSSPFSSTTPSNLVNPTLFTNTNLIKRRFYKGYATRSRTLTSKLFTVFGLLLGIGSGGAVYHTLVDKDSSFEQVLVSCEDNACDKEKENVKKNYCRTCIPKKCEDSCCLHRMDCEEQLIRRANADFERAITDTKGKAMDYTEEAMKAYCEAIDLMHDFLNHSYCLLDNEEMEFTEYEEAWCCMYKIAKKRCAKVKEAIQKGQCAWELLCRLREVVEGGKECKYTACHPLLATAEEAFSCAETELLNLKAKMDSVASEHEMVAQYKDVIQSFKADLKPEVEKEIASLECCDILYVEQEMAIMIQQAYAQVIRAQKELAQLLVCEERVPERVKCTCC